VSVIVWSSKNVSIFFRSNFSGYLVGTSGVKSKKFPIVFKNGRKNNQKIKEKW